MLLRGKNFISFYILKSSRQLLALKNCQQSNMLMSETNETSENVILMGWPVAAHDSHAQCLVLHSRETYWNEAAFVLFNSLVLPELLFATWKNLLKDVQRNLKHVEQLVEWFKNFFWRKNNPEKLNTKSRDDVNYAQLCILSFCQTMGNESSSFALNFIDRYRSSSNSNSTDFVGKRIE